MLSILLFVGPAAIGQTYFVYRLWRYSPGWRVTSVGRALMVIGAALAVLVNVFLFSELANYSGDRTFMVFGELSEVVGYLLVTVAIYWQLITLVRTQNRERRND